MSDVKLQERTQWLEGYYPPDMDAVGGWDRWIYRWTVAGKAPHGWIDFPPGYYTEERARATLRMLSAAPRCRSAER